MPLGKVLWKVPSVLPPREDTVRSQPPAPRRGSSPGRAMLAPRPCTSGPQNCERGVSVVGGSLRSLAVAARRLRPALPSEGGAFSPAAFPGASVQAGDAVLARLAP